MAKRPIIEIDVQDEKFQRFLKAYGEFTDSLDDIPDSWKRIDKTISGSGKNMTALSTKAAQSLGLSAKNAQKLEKAIKAASGSTKHLGDNAKKSASGFTVLRHNVERTHKAIGKIVGLTKKLGKYGLGLAGIGGGAALWGIAELAGSATRRQREARVSGMSPGVVSAFKSYLSYAVGSPSALMTKISEARQTTGDKWWLSSAVPGWQKMTNAQIAGQYILNAQAFMKRYKGSGVALTAAEKRGFGQALSQQDLLALQNIHTKTLRRNLSQAYAAAPGMTFNRQTGQQWVQLSMQLHASLITVETSLIKALSGLAGPLKNLSRSVSADVTKLLSGKTGKSFVNSLGRGIDDLAKTLTSKSFYQDVNQFFEGIKKLAKEIMVIADDLAWLLPTKKTPKDIANYYGGTLAGKPKSSPKSIGSWMSEIGNVVPQKKTKEMVGTTGSWGDTIHHHVTNAVNNAMSKQEIHVKVHNSTAARVDIMTHAAMNPQ